MNFAIRSLQTCYHFFIQIRNYLYNHGLFRVTNILVPVISVGNISFGGTGKTPMVIWIAQQIQKAGFTVVILSRGYKRRSYFTKVVSDTEKIRLSRRRAGDEPYLIAHKLPGVPVIVSRNRVRGASKAKKRFKPDVILLDDGFQHRRLARTVDIVLLDSPEAMHNNVFLREPLKNLRRADVVVFTKYDLYENAADIQGEMVKTLSCPVFRAQYKPAFIRNDEKKHPATILDKKTVWLVAGIAKPEYFRHTIKQAGAHISREFMYNDHARYSRWRMRRIIRKFRNSSANYFITTEKDWHKLKRWIPPETPCYYLDIDVDIYRASLFLKLIFDAAYLYKTEDIIE